MTNNKVGRNDPCRCGSGKKYKKCCLLSGKIKTEIINNKPAEKISEAVLKIAEPLLKKYNDENRISTLVELAIVAWNLSLTPEDKMKEAKEKMMNFMPDEVDPVTVTNIIEQILNMAERKNKFYSDIKYIIIEYKLTFDKSGNAHLDIGSAPIEQSE